MRALILAAPLFLLTGCPGSSLTTCEAEPDISGHWTFSLTPIDSGGIPRADTIEADLQQMPRPNSTLGALIWGTLTSTDKGFFDVLQIPELVMNNGSKTGGVVGCSVKINVPVTNAVTDDDADNGPLRLSLTGSIVGKGVMNGEPSTVIRVENKAMTQETFTWSGAQQ
ncbi:MAG TPA: hypothetical protein VN947_21745 [Polyangia bacterium]|nr:hypothetical protein [Polyangia bacterium]